MWRADKIWDQLRRCEKSLEDVRRGKRKWEDVRWELRRVEKNCENLRKVERNWDEKRWDKLKWHENRKEQSWSAEKGWEWERRHELRRADMRWKKAEKTWDELRWDGKTQTAVTEGCSEQFPRETALRWDQMKWEKNQQSKDMASDRKSRACCCEAQEGCLSPIGTETSAPGLPGHYFYPLSSSSHIPWPPLLGHWGGAFGEDLSDPQQIRRTILRKVKQKNSRNFSMWCSFSFFCCFLDTF